MFAIIWCKIFCLPLSKNIKIKIYRTIILSVILCGCETWSLTHRKEHSLRVFENRVLRRIFEAKKDEVRGKWRRLNQEKLYDLYSSSHIIQMIKSRKMRWAGHVARMVEGGRGEAHIGLWLET